MQDTTDRYSSVSRTLHWTIAGLILVNIGLGFLLGTVPPEGRIVPLQFHQGVGLTVLGLSLVRLGWRLSHPWPPLAAAMAGWEKALARFTHVAFYVVMIGIPLLGYAAVSAHPRSEGPSFFGLFTLPPFPIAKAQETANRFVEYHELAVFAAIGLLVLHVAGAIKGTYADKLGTLYRMIPRRGRPEEAG